jgi:ESCRT-II complex subunit VPS25
MLKVEDAETTGGDWDEVLRNERINRTAYSSFPSFLFDMYLGRLTSTHLSLILSSMVGNNLAVYEPAEQTRAVILHWRLPEEWAEALHEWVRVLAFHRALQYC